ncbi:hypothetical protein AB0958_18580 [Streptomyces sp. NPDC006655]|uniref:hypothetical protein n=1 Tax=Streptomyces sp. NPDC006655 TaxID=3156898 RepID=UPI0034515D85
MGIRKRVEMAVRRFAHQRGWLWSPSSAWAGMSFGKHGNVLLPVNARHRADVLRGHERFNAAMTEFSGAPDEAPEA